MEAVITPPVTDAEVLIIEDSLTQLEYLKYILESNHYVVSTAHSAEQALALLADHQPDVIISDVLMPGIDGYEFCRRTKDNPAHQHIPIILLTQLSAPDDIIKGLACGADNFIVKPYNREQLLSYLQYILVNQVLRQQTMPETTIDVFFRGQKYSINSNRFQIIDLLFSTYETALQKQKELEQKNRELQEALETIKVLEGFIPICANCKKIRDDQGYWQQIEIYIENHSKATFTHGICPECRDELYPMLKKTNLPPSDF
jgi:two-component system cell cycle response regulator